MVYTTLAAASTGRGRGRVRVEKSESAPAGTSREGMAVENGIEAVVKLEGESARVFSETASLKMKLCQLEQFKKEVLERYGLKTVSVERVDLLYKEDDEWFIAGDVVEVQKTFEGRPRKECLILVRIRDAGKAKEAQAESQEDLETILFTGAVAGKYRHPDPPPYVELLHREGPVEAMKQYVKDCLQDKGKSDGKFPLLGTSGMKGIGKSALLLYGVHKVVGVALEELQEEGKSNGRELRARAAFVGFSGNSTLASSVMEAYEAAGSPCYRSMRNAFGSALLTHCGVPFASAIKLRFEQSLRIYRGVLGLSDKESLILMVDEVGVLDKYSGAGFEGAYTNLLLSELMSEMDLRCGRLVFIFSHIRQALLEGQQTGSGRRVLLMRLQALPIDVWRQEPRDRAAKLTEAAKAHPGLHQLLLSCCGHPRSVFDGIDAALETLPDLLKTDDEWAFNRAREIVKATCKFNEFDDSFMIKVLPRWFDPLRQMRKQELAKDGLLLSLQRANVSKKDRGLDFLPPLVLQHWAEAHQEESALAYHLHKLYVNDAMLGQYSEKRMEGVMCHYEAVLRTAIRAKRFFLKNFYKSKHIAADIRAWRVSAKVPQENDLVYTVQDFKNKVEVLELLKEGFIVVSGDSNEVGLEYLAPFTKSDGDLIVAAVQCKFVSDDADWAEIKKKMKMARDRLTRWGVHTFPVVYTTADKSWIWKTTYNDGVYFVASDIFNFTAPKLGIMRLHAAKKMFREVAELDDDAIQ